jgi:hypothetical protein
MFLDDVVLFFIFLEKSCILDLINSSWIFVLRKHFMKKTPSALGFILFIVVQ